MKLFKHFVLVLFILSSTVARSQMRTVLLLDAETGLPTEGAIVSLQDSKGRSQSHISNKSGEITTTGLSSPIDIQIHHISYSDVQFQLSTSDTTIYLQPKTTTMDEVVISSDPYRDVAMSRDFYEVQEIDSKTIDQLGGNNLSDVLNYNINMTIVPDPATGRSTINMFGLSGEYVKVLVDNVPLASDNGAGNNIDISQINLQNVERIEVSEGAMGVLYGSNAVAGVVNIITKKNQGSKLLLNASVQEETVGSEYNWSNRGRHIQNLSISSNITDRLFVSGKVSNNHFDGFYHDYQGINYTGTDNLRGHQWNPKNQLSLTGLINYELTEKINAFYKYERYNENLNIYGNTVNDLLGIDGEPDHTAVDEEFISHRDVHQLNVSGFARKFPFWVIGSFQNQERLYEQYTYNIDYRAKVNSQGQITNQSSKVIYSKGNLDDVLPETEWLQLNLGYELEQQKGYDAIASGDYSDSISQQTLRYTDLYLTTPMRYGNQWTLTPGLRLNNNSNYNSHLIWSGALQHKSVKSGYSAKVVVGSAYKTPNFSQLYYYFVDANHDVTGNRDLLPEQGISVMLNLKKTSQVNQLRIESGLKGYNYNITKKITLVQILEEDENSGSSISRFTYLNTDNYKNYGITAENSITNGKFGFMLGADYIITRQYLSDADESHANSSTFSALSRVTYDIHKAGLHFGVHAKYNGSGRQFYQSGDTIEPGKLKSFTLVDASIRKSLFDQSLNITFGSRNLLNIVSVNATGLSSGRGHDGVAPTTQFFTTGRSFFLKIAYKISS